MYLDCFSVRVVSLAPRAALGEHDDALAVWPDDVVDLWLNFFPGDVGVFFQSTDLDFGVEVTDVTNDGVVLHGGHVFFGDHIEVTGGGHKDVGEFSGFVHGHHLEAFHAGLQGADGVDFGDEDGGALAAEGLGAALAHVAVAADHGLFTRHHDVGGALDAVDQGFAAAVEVVELRLGDAVVDVDGGEQIRVPLRCALDEAMHAGGGFFGNADDRGSLAGVEGGVFGQLGLDRWRRGMRSSSLSGSRSRTVDVLFSVACRGGQQGGVTTVVEDQVGLFTVGPVEEAVGVFPVLFQGLALLGEDRGCRLRRWRRRRGLGCCRCCSWPNARGRPGQPGSR